MTKKEVRFQGIPGASSTPGTLNYQGQWPSVIVVYLWIPKVWRTILSCHFAPPPPHYKIHGVGPARKVHQLKALAQRGIFTTFLKRVDCRKIILKIKAMQAENTALIKKRLVSYPNKIANSSVIKDTWCLLRFTTLWYPNPFPKDLVLKEEIRKIHRKHIGAVQ